jgi:NAD(P)-dependent dehydrogenase (short-subunit alcohol dehydrogenase family)
MGRFVDRNVIVTGAARGIGRAIVEAFVEDGARVFAADVRPDGLEDVRTSIDAARVRTHVVDLSDFEAARSMVRVAIEQLRRIHVLVNCAGVMPEGPVLEVSKETFDLTFAVNARAPLATMQVAGQHMAHEGGGSIVNIASANAFKNESPEAPYNASKAALVALTKAFAHELGHQRVRANCVAPGQTMTPETERETGADAEERRIEREYLRRIPLRRVGRAYEQAAAVLFLASDDAAFISGQTLIVDGGELGGGDWYDERLAPPVPADDENGAPNGM